MEKVKVIIDTNLWISFLITKNFTKLDVLITQKFIEIIYSIELLEEFLEVVNRPKLNKYFTNSDTLKIFEFLFNYGKLVDVTSNVNICRDEKDNFLLNLCIDSKSNYLVTGDNDLLILESIESTKIVSFSDFLDSFSKRLEE